MWSIPTVKYYSAIERHEVLTPATTWMNPENTASRKKPNTKAHPLYNSIHTKHPEQADTEAESRGAAASSWENAERRGTAMGTGFLFR